MKIREIRASVHTSAITVPLLERKVYGYGREEQKEFVFCEVETDDGLSGLAITGHFLARSVVVALKSYVLPEVFDASLLEYSCADICATMRTRVSHGVTVSALATCFVCPVVEMFDHWDQLSRRRTVPSTRWSSWHFRSSSGMVIVEECTLARISLIFTRSPSWYAGQVLKLRDFVLSLFPAISLFQPECGRPSCVLINHSCGHAVLR